MTTRYDIFEKLIDLTKMVKTKTGYNKMIQTGDIGHHDYGAGFLDLSIFYIFQEDTHLMRMWFGTIDDGDMGSWKEFDSKEEAEALIEKVANGVFADMVTFPSLKDLNDELREYGVYVCRE